MPPPLKFWCNGRGYPNAPAKFWAGTNNRGPPFVFVLELSGFVNNAAEFNGVNYLYPFTQETNPPLADSWHARSRWVNRPITVPQGKWLSVYTEWDYTLEQWQVSFQFRIRRVGLGITERWWRVHFSAGLRWGDNTSVFHWKQTPPWNGGGDNHQVILTGTYDRIPTDSCLREAT